MTKSFWIYTTWPDEVSAMNAADALVERRLCACANLLPGMKSVYRWQGEVHHDNECVLILKTSDAAATPLRDAISTLHPHDEPCILALPIISDHSAPGFLDWVQSQTTDFK
jgi:periplasmic divalent cation tolerance protein